MATEFDRDRTLASLRRAKTERRDAYWVGPLLTFIAYSAFVVYATYRVFEGQYYHAEVGGVEWYLSPFGSPDLTFLLPAGIAALVPFPITPALLILPFPAGFRFTCYYYRKSYYRAFARLPGACAVKPTGAKSHGGNYTYKGEKGILVFQNLHRYFLYFAIIIVFILAYDAIISIWQPGHGFHFGLGSLILVLNVVFLALYTFGCHALRHLVGGKLDCFSCGVYNQTRYKWWKGVTWLNQRHGLWAWVSLFTVALSDVYIRYIAANDIEFLFGVIPA